jgi:hypothetical protein
MLINSRLCVEIADQYKVLRNFFAISCFFVETVRYSMPFGVEIKGTAGFLKRIHGRFLLLLVSMNSSFDPPVWSEPERRYRCINGK